MHIQKPCMRVKQKRDQIKDADPRTEECRNNSGSYEYAISFYRNKDVRYIRRLHINYVAIHLNYFKDMHSQLYLYKYV